MSEERSYRFPIDLGNKFVTELRELSNDELFSLVNRINPSVGADGYMQRREAFCAMNIVLNERGLYSPGFRPLFRVKKRHVRASGIYTEEQRNLSCDLQVIDLHWLYLWYQYATSVEDDTFQELWSKETFDFTLASGFASKRWSAGSKAKILGLSENRFIQVQLSSIRTRSTFDFMRSLGDGENRVRQTLLAKMTDPRSRLQQAGIPEKLQRYRALRMANGSPKLAASLFHLMNGTVPANDINNQKSEHEAMQKAKRYFKDTGLIREEIRQLKAS